MCDSFLFIEYAFSDDICIYGRLCDHSKGVDGIVKLWECTTATTDQTHDAAGAASNAGATSLGGFSIRGSLEIHHGKKINSVCMIDPPAAANTKANESAAESSAPYSAADSSDNNASHSEGAMATRCSQRLLFVSDTSSNISMYKID